MLRSLAAVALALPLAAFAQPPKAYHPVPRRATRPPWGPACSAP